MIQFMHVVSSLGILIGRKLSEKLASMTESFLSKVTSLKICSVSKGTVNFSENTV